MSADPVSQEPDGVKDPDDYRQRQRIKSILEARDAVLEERRKALDMRTRGQIGQQLAEKIVREAVEAYILETEQTIQRYLPETDRESEWNNEERLAVDVWRRTKLGQLQTPAATYEFTGVSDLIEAPEQFREAWTEAETSHVGGSGQKNCTETFQVPMRVSKNAYRALNRFWNEMGMDLDMDHKLPTDKL